MTLTPFQVTMLDLELATGGHGATLWRAFRLPRSLDRARLERACAAVVASRPSLRLTPQGVASSAWAGLTDLACPDGIAKALDQLFDTPIRLAEGPLRLHWIDGSEEAVLAIGAHHAAIDFIALGDLIEALSAALRGEPPTSIATLQPPQQGSDLQSAARRLLLWRKTLANAPATLDLGGRDPAEPADYHPAASRWLPLPGWLAERARVYGTTPFVLVLTAIGLVLASRSGLDDCIVGVPHHGRLGRGRKRALASAMTLPMRITCEGEETFAHAVRRVRRALANAIANPPPRMADLVRVSGVTRAPGRPSLFQAIATGYGRGPKAALAMAYGAIDCGGHRLELVPLRERRTVMELSFAYGVADNGARLDLTYAADRYDEAIAEELLDAVGSTLEAARDDSAASEVRLRFGLRAAPPPRLSARDRQVVAGWLGEAANRGQVTVCAADGAALAPLLLGTLRVEGASPSPVALMARGLPDGAIELIGPAEPWRERRRPLARIERMLLDCPGVASACALERPGLAAAIVGDAQPQEVRRWLSRRLARELVPDIISLPTLPRSSEGSIDRAALANLPDPGPAPSGEQAVTIPELAAAWKELFGPGSLQDDADFFACGGDSLSAAMLVARLRDELNVNLTIADLLADPGLAAFSRRVELARWARMPMSGGARVISGEL